jgi:hypothetical protein
MFAIEKDGYAGHLSRYPSSDSSVSKGFCSTLVNLGSSAPASERVCQLAMIAQEILSDCFALEIEKPLMIPSSLLRYCSNDSVAVLVATSRSGSRTGPFSRISASKITFS